MLKSGFTMSDINGIYDYCRIIFKSNNKNSGTLELQFGFEAEDPRRQQQQGGSRPTAPERHGRMRSIDYNTNGHDINGHPSDAGHTKGILRATSELPTGRQTREQDRTTKARTPDVDKEKKRGKSPFK